MPKSSASDNRIIRELPLIRRYSRHNASEDRDFRSYLKNRLKMPGDELDALVRETADAVWAQIDCTTCANCCKTYEITVDDRDIQRLAARLDVPTRVFQRRYVTVEPDKTKHFTLSPCPFLGEDNLCTVYADRPQSCRDFPYLHSQGFRQRTLTMLENVDECPIVFNVWQRLKQRLWRTGR